MVNYVSPWRCLGDPCVSSLGRIWTGHNREGLLPADVDKDRAIGDGFLNVVISGTLSTWLFCPSSLTDSHLFFSISSLPFDVFCNKEETLLGCHSWTNRALCCHHTPFLALSITPVGPGASPPRRERESCWNFPTLDGRCDLVYSLQHGNRVLWTPKPLPCRLALKQAQGVWPRPVDPSERWLS